MGRAKKGPKFAAMKKMITSKAIKHYKEEVLNPKKKDLSKEKLPRNVKAQILHGPQVSSALYFDYNMALGGKQMTWRPSAVNRNERNRTVKQ